MFRRLKNVELRSAVVVLDSIQRGLASSFGSFAACYQQLLLSDKFIAMLGRELENRANKLVRESKERAEKAKRQAEKERILRQRQDERQRQFEEQRSQQRLAEEAAVEAVSVCIDVCSTAVYLA